MTEIAQPAAYHNHNSSFSSTWTKDISLLALRLFAAYEFWEAGVEKWNGENWFAEIQTAFPFPFNVLPADLNWFTAMGVELVAPVLLVFGLFSRYAAAALFMLTAVAWYAVHAENGYNIVQNGYKMALIYCLVMLPVILQGSGKLSLDTLLKKKFSKIPL